MVGKILRVAMPVALALSLIGAGPAKADTNVWATGNCTAASTWKLHLDASGGIVSLGFKVETATPNEVWHVKIHHGRRTVLRALKLTGDDGSFRVELLNRDWRGFDLFHVRAVDVTTHEVCVARGVV